MKRVFLIASMLTLAGCGEADDPPPPAEEETPAISALDETGAALLSFPDGTEAINFATADGSYYGGPVVGPDFAMWSVKDGKGCIDPPDEDEFCFTYGPVAEDGTFPVEGDDGLLATLTPLGVSYTVGEIPPYQADAVLVDFPDGTRGMSIWTDDGKSYLTREVQTGTWRNEGDKRCFLPDGGQEGCSTPGPVGEDKSFTVIPDEGEPFTVTLLD